MTDVDEGYPDSPAEDLDPGPDVIGSLDEADREMSSEHRHELPGRRPEGSPEEEDQRLDAHDADDLANTQWTPHVMGGASPVDQPNFNDNEANWSRDRS